jgi:hypothetical protein
MTATSNAAEIHACVKTKLGVASFRDATADDADWIAAYFYRPDAHLDTLIDRSKLGSPTEMAAGFRAMVRSGDPGQQRTAFVIDLGDHRIGFTTLFRQSPEVNYSHWHIVDADARAGGISTALYPHRIKMYFDLFPIARLIHQTKTSNTGVNRMLDKFVPAAETIWIGNPDGLASPGEFVIRFVLRSDIPRILERAKTLGLVT